MGGAGVALPNDALGALSLNPALLTQIDGHKMEFSAEYNTAKNAVESEIGPFSGRTEEEGDPSLIPAFGFTVHKPGAGSAFGVGFLGLAGFGVDYPQTAGNPILSPQPNGFGRVYSNYQYMKVPLTFAFDVSPNLSIGASLNAGRATLTANPAGFAAPDCSSAGELLRPERQRATAPGASAPRSACSGRPPARSTSASPTPPSRTSRISSGTPRWPTRPCRPSARTAPSSSSSTRRPSSSAGIGWRPTSKLSIAFDGKQIFYEDTEGFKDALGFAGHHGLRPGPPVPGHSVGCTLRLGGNHGDSPIESDRVFFTVPVPAVFEDRITAGFGMRVTPSPGGQPGLLPRVREPGQRPDLLARAARSRAAASPPRWRWTRSSPPSRSTCDPLIRPSEKGAGRPPSPVPDVPPFPVPLPPSRRT